MPFKHSFHPTLCPFCSFANPLVTDVPREGEEDPGRAPIDGDLSFCWQCGETSVFDTTHTGGLRRPDLKEQVEIMTDTLLIDAKRAWQQIKQKGNAL